MTMDATDKNAPESGRSLIVDATTTIRNGSSRMMLVDPVTISTPQANDPQSFECLLETAEKRELPTNKPVLEEVDNSEKAEGLDPVNEDYGNQGVNSTVVCPLWSRITDALHHATQNLVLSLSLAAARNPIPAIICPILISFALIFAGYSTNFHINVEENEIYTPFHSISRLHNEWFLQESGLSDAARSTILMIHSHGDNVMSVNAMRHVFEALDTVRNTTGYDDICADGEHWDEHKEEYTCQVVSATRFWYHDYELFKSQVKFESDLVLQLSSMEYPGGRPTDSEYVMGKLARTDVGLVTYVPTFFVYILLTDKGEQTLEFEAEVLERLANLQANWDEDDSNPLHLDYFAERSGADEFRRAIEADMYLLPVVFLAMSGFTCLVFFQFNLVQSRCLLGVGSIVSILLALFSGFGILFICGIPFTSMTQLLPFVVFGVGLDDTFIITGAYLRTDPSLATEERIQLAIMEAGPSITVTTITTASAFLLGLTSSVPSIYWLCLYAFPTITIVYIYQLTFFVAILVLDERRIKDNRIDIFICCKCSAMGKESQEIVKDETEHAAVVPSTHCADKIMKAYANLLLHPFSKLLVLVVFSALFGYCVYRTTMLKQDIDIKTLFADDSYMIPALDIMDNFQERSYAFHIFFRNEDQSDPLIQQQMISFVEEIQELPALGAPPPLCWVRDLEAMKETDYFDVVRNLTFPEQLKFAMSIPAFKEAYGGDIVIDEVSGNITASRCVILGRNSFLLDSVQNTIDYLNGQRALTDAQPINFGKAVGEESFFTFQNIYLVWEFYNVAIGELIWTTLLSVAVVSLVTLIFIPHWTAVCFVVPMVSVVYIDLLGVMELAGLDINAVTYVCLVISIGLIVDFLLHVMLRYVESSHKSRDERVKETLRTMGSSILLGGISTFFGIMTMVFGTSMIMRTVFISLCAMVVLALAHGLIVLPVLLSLFGPTSTAMSSDMGEFPRVAVVRRRQTPQQQQQSDALETGSVAASVFTFGMSSVVTQITC